MALAFPFEGPRPAVPARRRIALQLAAGRPGKRTFGVAEPQEAMLAGVTAVRIDGEQSG